MHIQTSQDNDELEINVIPLIDVLLTLLMFFALTTTFIKQSSISIHLPKAAATSAAKISQEVVVSIDEDGNYYVDDVRIDHQQLQSLGQAVAKLAREGIDRTVVLNADMQSKHQAVVTLMDMLGQQGFEHIAIATQPLD